MKKKLEPDWMPQHLIGVEESEHLVGRLDIKNVSHWPVGYVHVSTCTGNWTLFMY